MASVERNGVKFRPRGEYSVYTELQRGNEVCQVFHVFSSARLCQQKLAEIMKSKFGPRRPVRAAINSEPNAWISFKFWFLVPLGHTLELFESKTHFLIFLFVFINILFLIRSRKFSNFS